MGRASSVPEPEWSLPGLRDPRYSQSVERGLAILCCFTPERPVRGMAEVAGELDMARSTAHRYMTTLLELGYLEQVAGRKYRLSLRVTDLGMSSVNATGLREHAHADLEETCRRTGHTISMSVLDGTEIVIVDRVNSFTRARIETGLQPGSRLPAHCTSMGKLLLAFLPAHERHERIAEMTLARHGPNTITSKNALRKALEEIADTGIALSEEEFAPERCSMAVPVRDASPDVTAALSMRARSSTIPAQGLADALAPHLIATADRISARLGFRRDNERYEL